MVELVTNIPTLEVLSKCSIEPYDAIYLGNPYCWDYDGNLISNFNDLEVAIEMLKEMGKKVYITTFAAPRNADLPKIFKLIDEALELNVDAIESTNYGVINYIKKSTILGFTLAALRTSIHRQLLNYWKIWVLKG